MKADFETVMEGGGGEVWYTPRCQQEVNKVEDYGYTGKMAAGGTYKMAVEREKAKMAAEQVHSQTLPPMTGVDPALSNGSCPVEISSCLLFCAEY